MNGFRKVTGFFAFFLVRDADDRRFRDRGVFHQDIFDFERVNVFARADNEFLFTPHNGRVAVIVEESEIARMQPAIRGDGLGGDAYLQVMSGGDALQSTGILAAAGGAGAGAGTPGYGDVYVSAASATIGQVSGTSGVEIYTSVGAIADGNAGLNVLAPVATLPDMAA